MGGGASLSSGSNRGDSSADFADFAEEREYDEVVVKFIRKSELTWTHLKDPSSTAYEIVADKIRHESEDDRDKIVTALTQLKWDEGSTREDFVQMMKDGKDKLGRSIEKAKKTAREAYKYVQENKARSAMEAAGGLGEALKLSASLVPPPADKYIKGLGEALCVYVISSSTSAYCISLRT